MRALFVGGAILVAAADGFAPITTRRFHSTLSHHDRSSLAFHATSTITSKNDLHYSRKIPDIRQTKLCMSDEKEGPGLVTAIFISGVLLFFVASAFAPLMDFAATTPSSNDLNLGDAVVTRQDGGEKLKNYQSKFDALSSTKIQEKLSNLPVFYLSVDDGSSMSDRIYLSYNEAENDAKSSSGTSSGTVRATTLDQVMYPLILKREAGKTKLKTPVEIKNAKESVGADGKSYCLIPTTAALEDAKDMTLKEGDIPLFVVERLAFAGNDGRPEVPLFTEKGDAIISYSRLQAGSSTLPKEPSIRTTSLLDVLESMEKGTRPAVGQLQLYGNADDVIKADELKSQ